MKIIPENSYCHIARGHEFHGPYHDREYGFPLDGDDALFERLLLEIIQAGLSWLTILKKRDGFRAAYDGFSVDRIARYGADDRARLLDDARIIRNRLKVELFKKTFRFTGGEITGEFLMSIGYLDGAHHPACPVYDEIAALGPRWMGER